MLKLLSVPVLVFCWRLCVGFNGFSLTTLTVDNCAEENNKEVNEMKTMFGKSRERMFLNNYINEERR
jgi:hypothetical protein